MLKKWSASLMVLLGAASFGFLSTMVKLAYQQGFSTAEVIGSQVFFGCLATWGYYWFTRLRTSRRSWMATSGTSHNALFFMPDTHLSLSKTGKLLFCGVFSGMTGIFYYLSLQTIAASLGVVLLFQFTWMGMLVDALFKKRLPGRYQWLALICIVPGTIAAAGSFGTLSAKLNLMGILLGLLAAVSYTGFITVSGQVALDIAPSLRSALMVTGATLVSFLIFPPLFLINGALWHGLFVWGLLLGLFGMVIPPILYAMGVPYTGTGIAALLGSIELPVVIMLSLLVLHEPMQWLQLAGVLLILLGIIVAQLKELQRSPKSASTPQ